MTQPRTVILHSVAVSAQAWFEVEFRETTQKPEDVRPPNTTMPERWTFTSRTSTYTVDGVQQKAPQMYAALELMIGRTVEITDTWPELGDDDVFALQIVAGGRLYRLVDHDSEEETK